MTTWNWTQVTLTSLIIATLSGCAVPGRFSGDQYIAMDSDPFLDDSNSMIAKSNDVVQVRPISVPEVTDRPGTMPKAATGSTCDSDIVCQTAQATHARNPSGNSQDTLANLFEVEEQPKKILQMAAETTTEVRDEFDTFMKTQQDRVVHAVAEVRETAETSGDNFRKQLENDAFWGFPEDNPANAASTKMHRFSGSEATADNHNPFFEDSSEPIVAPPADVFGDSSANDAFPPGDFEFN